MIAPARGILLMLLSIFAFTAMDATVKALVDHTPLIQVVWVRYMLPALVLLGLQSRDPLRLVRSHHPRLQMLRSVLQLGATSFFFASLQFIGLAAATAIADLSPALIALGAALVLAERIGPRRLIGAGVALIGAMIIIRPGSDVFSPASLLPLAAALCYTGNVLATRKIGGADEMRTSLFYGAALGAVTTTLALPFVWQPIAAKDLILFALIGGLGMGAQFLMIEALRIAEASLLAPFTQTDLIFATFWGILLFGEYPDRWTIIGALVVAGAGLYVWHRETRAARAAA